MSNAFKTILLIAACAFATPCAAQDEDPIQDIPGLTVFGIVGFPGIDSSFGNTPRFEPKSMMLAPSEGATAAGQEQTCTAGNPIIPATGNKIEPEQDFIVGGQAGLVFRRTYNHEWIGTGLFGRHWTSSLDYKLVNGTQILGNVCVGTTPECTLGSTNSIQAWRPDGRTIMYLRQWDNPDV